MPIHALTIEKEALKKLAWEIKSLKYFLRWTLYEGPDMIKRKISPAEAKDRSLHQKKLAKLKYIYRHRHFAYCQVRANIAQKVRKIEGQGKGKPLNTKLVNFQMNRILTAIAIGQSEYIDALLATEALACKKIDAISASINKPETVSDAVFDLFKTFVNIPPAKTPIAIFRPDDNSGEICIALENFTRQPNGDWTWVCKKPGMLYNAMQNWEAGVGSIVTLSEEEYNRLF
jgi:hypothetical protein